MINLYTRHVGHLQYCFGNPTAKLAPQHWADSILTAADNYHYAEFNPNHSVFTRRPFITSFDQLPTPDSHPELFL